jgi:hypothetical protein
MVKRAKIDIRTEPKRPAPKVENEALAGARDGLKLVGAHVPPSVAKRFNMLAAKLEKTKQDLMVEALEDLFTKHGG